MQFDSPEMLQHELEQNLLKGRAFVPGDWQAQLRERCELRLVHPQGGASLILEAEVVYPTADGVGLELLGFCADIKEQLSAFAARASDPAPDPDEQCVESHPPSGRGTSIFLRLRGLRAGQRERIARSGNLMERTTLERIYGSTVWDALLENPQLTGPEVARIAKNGTASQPIIAIIAGSSAWLSKPEVRRALLSNPRLGGAHLERVLRALPREELRKVPQQTAYPKRVRAAASRLVIR
jgi:hypothetical protein